MDIKEWLPDFKVSTESDPDLMSYFVKTKHCEFKKGIANK